ncbi:hypothetical protein DFH09DRAFT_1370321 [Mycena vulgaris]|nr:hypothetical protein DFH09DRAFT_1370321 [Mycena vulgaris]
MSEDAPEAPNPFDEVDTRAAVEDYPGGGGIERPSGGVAPVHPARTTRATPSSPPPCDAEDKPARAEAEDGQWQRKNPTRARGGVGFDYRGRGRICGCGCGCGCGEKSVWRSWSCGHSESDSSQPQATTRNASAPPQHGVEFLALSTFLPFRRRRPPSRYGYSPRIRRLAPSVQYTQPAAAPRNLLPPHPCLRPTPPSVHRRFLKLALVAKGMLSRSWSVCQAPAPPPPRRIAHTPNQRVRLILVDADNSLRRGTRGVGERGIRRYLGPWRGDDLGRDLALSCSQTHTGRRPAA